MRRYLFLGIAFVLAPIAIAVALLPFPSAVDRHLVTEAPLTDMRWHPCTCRQHQGGAFPCAVPDSCVSCRPRDGATLPHEEPSATPVEAAILIDRVRTPDDPEPSYLDSFVRRDRAPLWMTNPSACCLGNRASTMHYAHRN